MSTDDFEFGPLSVHEHVVVFGVEVLGIDGISGEQAVKPLEAHSHVGFKEYSGEFHLLPHQFLDRFRGFANDDVVFCGSLCQRDVHHGTKASLRLLFDGLHFF